MEKKDVGKMAIAMAHIISPILIVKKVDALDINSSIFQIILDELLFCTISPFFTQLVKDYCKTENFHYQNQ